MKKRFVHALAFCLLVFISQNGLAQFVCATGDEAITYKPNNNCPLSSIGGTTTYVAAISRHFSSLKSPGNSSFGGDLGR